MKSRSQVEDERPIGSHSKNEVTIDQLDKRILARLLIEGRTSFRQMAQEFHTSTSTVSSRVSRLEKSGFITGYSATVNFEALGYDLTAVTEIRVSKGKLFEMEKEIAKLPGVCAVYDVTGEVDGMIVAKFRKREELSRFTKGLLSMPFVERANSHIVLNTFREDFRVPL
ncbi:MAG: Lrp/AsnC family transcriptional regulator [Nitrososphaerales archaeon]|jgi:DNA-binding Lrp family transcriptional regulator